LKDKGQIKFISNFGEKVKELRVSQNISRVQMAFEIGCNEKQLRLIEKGEINTGILSIYKIAKVLEIEPYELLKF
jgi:transcriptional regulator with XRE-family HTH domain